jgi:hypothetical protein
MVPSSRRVLSGKQLKSRDEVVATNSFDHQSSLLGLGLNVFMSFYTLCKRSERGVGWRSWFTASGGWFHISQMNSKCW